MSISQHVPLTMMIAGGLLLAATVSVGHAQGESAADTRAQFLALIDRPKVPLAPSPAVRSTTSDGYAQELLSFATSGAERVPTLVLSKGPAAGRRAVVIALHGTGGSKDSMRALLRPYVEQGFLGVAIDAPHHGERARPIPGLSIAYQSAMLRAYRSGEGHPYLYDTVWDVMRLLDYLATRPDVDPSRIGIIGNSKGGTEAYLAAAVDDRIAVAAPLIGVQSFGWSLRHSAAWEARTWTFHEAVEAAAADSKQPVDGAFMKQFYDRIAPGLVDRFDGPAMVALIAPRPLIIVNGDSDPRSPLGGVREAVQSAEHAYAAAGAKDRLSFVLQTDAAHEVTPEAARTVAQWFVRWLSPQRVN